MYCGEGEHYIEFVGFLLVSLGELIGLRLTVLAIKLCGTLPPFANHQR